MDEERSTDLHRARMLDAVAKGSDPDRPSPLAITSAIIGELALLPGVTMETWRAEMRAISLAAASSGDFKSAIDGYKEIGKELGVVAETPQNHLHIHNPIENMQGATTEQLEERLEAINRQKKLVKESTVEAEVVKQDTDDELAALLA